MNRIIQEKQWRQESKNFLEKLGSPVPLESCVNCAYYRITAFRCYMAGDFPMKKKPSDTCKSFVKSDNDLK